MLSATGFQPGLEDAASFFTCGWVAGWLRKEADHLDVYLRWSVRRRANREASPAAHANGACRSLSISVFRRNWHVHAPAFLFRRAFRAVSGGLRGSVSAQNGALTSPCVLHPGACSTSIHSCLSRRRHSCDSSLFRFPSFILSPCPPSSSFLPPLLPQTTTWLWSLGPRAVLASSQPATASRLGLADRLVTDGAASQRPGCMHGGWCARSFNAACALHSIYTTL